MNRISIDEQRLEQLREAAEWRMIGLLFECPAGDWRSAVIDLARELADEELVEAANRAVQEANEGLYHSTFGPGGPAAPREVSHRDVLQPGGLLAELQAFYDAFAYRWSTPEPLDHVAVEAGFVAYLRLKEIYARSLGDTEQAAVASEAARQFIHEHLSLIADPLAISLECSGIHYLSLAARALRQRVARSKAEYFEIGSAQDAPRAGTTLNVSDDEFCCGAGG